MATYVDSVLGNGEEVLHESQISLIPFALWFFFGAIFLFSGAMLVIGSLALKDGAAGIALIVFLIGALMAIRPFVARLTTELVITNRRVIAKFGLFSRRTIEVNLSKVESIRVDQSLVGRIANYGTIFVVGTGGSKEPIPGISHPLEFRKKYDEVQTAHDAKS